MKPTSERDVFPMPGHLVRTTDGYFGIILTANLGFDHHEWSVMLANGLTVGLPREHFKIAPMKTDRHGSPECSLACFVELVEAYNARFHDTGDSALQDNTEVRIMADREIGTRKQWTVAALRELLADENPEALISVVAVTDEGHVVGDCVLTIMANGDQQIMLVAFNPRLEEET